MDNDEIRNLLRDLKNNAEEDGEVKSKTIKIDLNNGSQPDRSSRAKKRNGSKKRKDFAKLRTTTNKNHSSRSFRKRFRLAADAWFDDLKAKGISWKELLMIAAGILLTLFIVIALLSALFAEESSVNVTADEGLTVTVEQEPQEWCSHGTVILGIRTAQPIQSVTVNGSACEFEAGSRTRVTLVAAQERLEVMVVSEESVMNAAVEIPMIDTENPLVSVKQENGQVTLNAVDSRSGLEGIYYGTLDGFSDIPQYQKYTGPFSYEPEKTYYYYAKDHAGNATIPVATNMQPAQNLALSDSQATLLPGSSFNLGVSTEPAGAYCNNLQMINRDPSIVSLASDGTVTALQVGEAVIEVSADELSTVRCEIKVKSEAEVTISALGDCTLGTDIYFSPMNSFDTVQSMYGNSYFFQNVRSILDGDDITFANFEGTLTTLDTRSEKQYAFKGDPSYVEILQDGSVEAVTLANNHSSDYGSQSLIDTKQYLVEAGIAYCDGDEIIIKEVNGIKVGLIGIYVLDTGMEKASQLERAITAVKEAGAQIIVTAFHWGTEKSTQPDEIQQSLAHTAIDLGADLVVGHHPHVLQGIEQYRGKYIAYSLGNFCFGGNSTPSDMDTMIFQQTFTVGKNGMLQDSQINIIPCSISSDPGWNNYQPTPAQGQEAERIMNKINELCAQFGTSF